MMTGRVPVVTTRGKVGFVVRRFDRERVLVRFPGQPFPADMRLVRIDHLRELLPARRRVAKRVSEDRSVAR